MFNHHLLAGFNSLSLSTGGATSLDSLGFQQASTPPSPSYVGATSTNGASSLSLTGITGLAEGDVVVVALSDDNSEVVVTSSGWTTISTGAQNSIEYGFLYKVMGATPDTSIDLDDTIDALTATAYRNVDASGIQTSSVISNSGGINAQAGPLVSAAANSVFIILTCTDDDSDSIATAPTGYTIAVDDGRGGGSNGQLYRLGVSSPDEASQLTIGWGLPDAKIGTLIAFPPGGVSARNAAGFRIPDPLTLTHGTVASGSSATMSIPYPSNIQAGDYLIVVGSRSGNTATVPSGWTSDSNSTHEFSYHKTATGNESGNLSISGGNVGYVGLMYLVKTSLSLSFVGHSGAFFSDAAPSVTCAANDGTVDVFLNHYFVGGPRTPTTSPNAVTLDASTNNNRAGYFYSALDIGGTTITSQWSSSINTRLDQYSFS